MRGSSPLRKIRKASRSTRCRSTGVETPRPLREKASKRPESSAARSTVSRISRTWDRRASSGGQPQLEEFGRPGNAAEHVVEIVGHAARQAADGVQLLCVVELLLEEPLLGDVAHEGQQHRRFVRLAEGLDAHLRVEPASVHCLMDPLKGLERLVGGRPGDLPGRVGRRSGRRAGSAATDPSPNSR